VHQGGRKNDNTISIPLYCLVDDSWLHFGIRLVSVIHPFNCITHSCPNNICKNHYSKGMEEYYIPIIRKRWKKEKASFDSGWNFVLSVFLRHGLFVVAAWTSALHLYEKEMKTCLACLYRRFYDTHRCRKRKGTNRCILCLLKN